MCNNDLLDTYVPCKYCGELTNMTNTKLCNGCWELERRIENNIKLSKKIIKKLLEEQNGKDIKS